MQALEEALFSGHLGGAGLDVHWVVSGHHILCLPQHMHVGCAAHGCMAF